MLVAELVAAVAVTAAHHGEESAAAANALHSLRQCWAGFALLGRLCTHIALPHRGTAMPVEAAGMRGYQQWERARRTCDSPLEKMTPMGRRRRDDPDRGRCSPWRERAIGARVSCRQLSSQCWSPGDVVYRRCSGQATCREQGRRTSRTDDVIFVITCSPQSPFIASASHRAAFVMWVGWVWCARRVVRHNVKTPRRLLSTQALPQADSLVRATRNIGIIAHIDAVSSTEFTNSHLLKIAGKNDDD